MEQLVIIIQSTILVICAVYFVLAFIMHSAKRKKLQRILDEATNTDGGHHKQWYLFEIGKNLHIHPNSDDSGIAP